MSVLDRGMDVAAGALVVCLAVCVVSRVTGQMAPGIAACCVAGVLLAATAVRLLLHLPSRPADPGPGWDGGGGGEDSPPPCPPTPAGGAQHDWDGAAARLVREAQRREERRR